MYQHKHNGSSRGKESEERAEKNIWRNNRWKFHKFDRNHLPIHPTCLKNPEGKFLVIYT